MSKHWPKVKLFDVVVPASRGETPIAGKAYRQIGVKLWGQGAYERETLDGSQTKYSQLFRAETGDLIVNKIWARNGSVAVVPAALSGCYGSGEFPMFTPNSELLTPNWLHWLTKTPGFWEQCDEKSRGTSGKNRIKPEQFLSIEIPLPSLAEQKRVVARIEELAAQIQEARTLRHQATQETQALGITTSAKRFRAIKEQMPLGDLIADGTTISYGVLVPGPEVEDGIPFIRIQDLAVTNASERPSKRISPEVEKAYARTRLKGGEILIAVVGATIGKVGVAPKSWCGANIARAVCRIVPNSKIERDFLVHFLQSQDAQDYFKTTTRTLAQPTLNVGQLERTPIPVPPLDEQRRVVYELDTLQAEMDALRQLQTETAKELDALLPAILDRAFKGEL